MSAPWGPPGPPWQPQQWQPQQWQPQQWQPEPWPPEPWPPQQWPPAPWAPPPLPPVVPARSVLGGVEQGGVEQGGGPPRGRGLWVLLAVLAGLVLVAGTVLAVLLGQGGSEPTAAPAPATAPALLPGGGQPVRLASIPARVVLEPALGWDRSVTGGPHGATASTALRFVQAVRAHDWRAAFRVCAPGLRAAAAERSPILRVEPAVVVGAAFYGDALRGRTVVGGRLDGVAAAPVGDLVTFRLRLDDGTGADVVLRMGSGQSVEDWTG